MKKDDVALVIRLARFQMFSRESIRAKEEMQKEEDARVFHAIALTMCTPGSILVWDEQEAEQGSIMGT